MVLPLPFSIKANTYSNITNTLQFIDAYNMTNQNYMMITNNTFLDAYHAFSPVQTNIPVLNDLLFVIHQPVLAKMIIEILVLSKLHDKRLNMAVTSIYLACIIHTCKYTHIHITYTRTQARTHTQAQICRHAHAHTHTHTHTQAHVSKTCNHTIINYINRKIHCISPSQFFSSTLPLLLRSRYTFPESNKSSD